MLHANPKDGFFTFGSIGLDGAAMKLILKKLDDPVCSRFMGNPIIDPDFLETTAAHEIRTYETVENVLTRVLPKDHDHTDTLAHYKAMILLHDVSDIIKEVIIAATETDPVLKAQCSDHIRAYDLTITPFVYRLAMFAKAEGNNRIFYDAIDELRSRTLLAEQYGRAFTIDEATGFCDLAIKHVRAMNASLGGFKNWDTRTSRQKTAIMLRHYNEIELTTSFAGLQSQIHEKCDGTQYAASISDYKNQNGMTPTLYHSPPHIQDRINGRYEKNIDLLMKTAGDDAFKQALAAASIMHCYSVSLNTVTQGKEMWEHSPQGAFPTEQDHDDLHKQYEASLIDRFKQNDKSITARTHAQSVYTEALQDAQHNGIIWIPKSGQTLLSSKDAIQRIPLAPQARQALQQS